VLKTVSLWHGNREKMSDILLKLRTHVLLNIDLRVGSFEKMLKQIKILESQQKQHLGLLQLKQADITQ
jgi:hypothetical protein